jgi:hypothetical protein
MTPASIQTEIRELARLFYERRKAAYASPPQWQEVSPTSFPHLDLRFYDRASQEFISNGFRWLGDKENVTVSRLFPEQQTFLRGFLGDDGATSASIWHTRLLGRARVMMMTRDVNVGIRGVALASEFEDGSFVITSNVKGHDSGIDVPRVTTQRLGQQAPISSLLKLHRSAVAERKAAAAIVVRARNVNDVLASGQRLQDQAAAHMAEIGYFDEAVETARWRDSLSPDSLRLLFAELRALHAADAAAR